MELHYGLVGFCSQASRITTMTLMHVARGERKFTRNKSRIPTEYSSQDQNQPSRWSGVSHSSQARCRGLGLVPNVMSNADGEHVSARALPIHSSLPGVAHVQQAVSRELNLALAVTSKVESDTDNASNQSVKRTRLLLLLGH